MAKFTANHNDIMHLQQIQADVLSTAMRNQGRLKAVMLDGTNVTGRLSGQAGGNNTGQGGFWAYWGEFSIVDAQGTTHAIDCLEVDYVTRP